MTHRTKPISTLLPQCELFAEIADALNEAFKEANIHVTLGLGTSPDKMDMTPSIFFFGIYVRGAENDDLDLNEPLGTPAACNLGEACESCQ